MSKAQGWMAIGWLMMIAAGQAGPLESFARFGAIIVMVFAAMMMLMEDEE